MVYAKVSELFLDLKNLKKSEEYAIKAIQKDSINGEGFYRMARVFEDKAVATGENGELYEQERADGTTKIRRREQPNRLEACAWYKQALNKSLGHLSDYEHMIFLWSYSVCLFETTDGSHLNEVLALMIHYNQFVLDKLENKIFWRRWLCALDALYISFCINEPDVDLTKFNLICARIMLIQKPSLENYTT